MFVYWHWATLLSERNTLHLKGIEAVKNVLSTTGKGINPGGWGSQPPQILGRKCRGDRRGS